MATTVNLNDANTYFDNEVLHNDEWVKADDATRQRALNQAERVLYREFRDVYDIVDPTKQIPVNAIYEQALWMLRQNSTIRKSEFGVTGVSVSGIQVQTKGTSPSLIAPEAMKIIEEDIDMNKRSTTIGWWTL